MRNTFRQDIIINKVTYTDRGLLHSLNDKKPVIVKLSAHAKKLENEYQTTTRLTAAIVDGQYLVKPIELFSEPHGISALVFEDDGMTLGKITNECGRL